MRTKALILGAGKGSRMRSDLPKVLHPVSGRPMVMWAIDRARGAGIDEVIVVVGYKKEQVMSALAATAAKFAIQDEQRGTGHAVMAARAHLEGFDGNVVVLYGDMPLLGEATIRSLIDRRDELDAAAIALTIELDNPPDYGRIVRDAGGALCRVVEVKDCTPEELAIREVNVGAYCFDCRSLLDALGQLGDDNAQGEYYLTDVFATMAATGQRTDTVVTPKLEEALGVNDPGALAFAEKLGDIEYAESLYELVDRTANAEREAE
jgi:bifunctional UDP-N-acetylglucosamine pyrophosphorylase/glucosamine-1-phosphate N-acetyltransferase